MTTSTCNPRFPLGTPVAISVSGETGEVVGVAYYANSFEPQYLVRYKAGDGRAVEAWWTENALKAVA